MGELFKNKKGLTVVEVILAVGIFTTFATAAIVGMLSSFDLDRLGLEQTIATQYATEGIEALRSLKNQSFINLINTNSTGIAQTGGVWALSSGQNVFNNYTRTLSISSVFRDSMGNIAPTGTVDPHLKKVTSQVTWQHSGGRNNAINLTTYFSDFKQGPTPKGGLLVYGDGGISSNAVSYQILDPNSAAWSFPSTINLSGISSTMALRAVRLYASSLRNEKMMTGRFVDSSTNAQVIIAESFDGSNWSNPLQLASFTSGSYLDVRNFDGAYLGDGTFLTVYSDNTTVPKYRVFNGSSWSAQSSLSDLGSNGSGIPVYIVAKARPRTNEVMAAFFDVKRNTNTEYYNGNSWTLHPRHGSNAPSNTKELVSFSWLPSNTSVPTQGALFFAASGGARGTSAKIWTANGTGGGSWSGAQVTSNQSGRIGALGSSGQVNGSMFLSCDKTTNNTIYCFKTTTDPLWSSPTNNILTNSTDSGIQRSFDVAFEGLSGNLAIAVFSDNNANNGASLKKYDPSTDAFDSSSTGINGISGNLMTVKLAPSDLSDDIMVFLGDDSLSSYTVVWNGKTQAFYASPSGKAFTTHGTNGSSTTDYWYDFAWDQF